MKPFLAKLSAKCSEEFFGLILLNQLSQISSPEIDFKKEFHNQCLMDRSGSNLYNNNLKRKKKDHYVIYIINLSKYYTFETGNIVGNKHRHFSISNLTLARRHPVEIIFENEIRARSFNALLFETSDFQT
jgi:hypothetical protein